MIRAAAAAVARRRAAGGGGGSVTYDNSAPDTTAEDVQTVTSGAWTISSSANRAVFGMGFSANSNVQTPSEMRVGGSGGTVMSTLGSPFTVHAFRAQAFGVAGVAGGSTTGYLGFPTAPGPQFSILSMLSYTGVNQTTPFVAVATPTDGIVEVPVTGGATTGTASITINTTGYVGSKAVVFLAAIAGGGDIPTFTPQGTAVERNMTNFLDFMFVQQVEFPIVGNSTTVDVLIANLSTADAFCQWQMVGFVVNPA